LGADAAENGIRKWLTFASKSHDFEGGGMYERTIKLGVVAALLILTPISQIRAQEPENRAGFLKYDIEQEAVIRKQFADFNAAWNRHDVKAMMSIFALDADHIDPDLRMVRGRDQIEKLFEAEHGTVFKEAQAALAVDSVWFVTENVALLDGSYEISGVKGPDGKALPNSKGHLTGLLLKEHDRWWVVASRAILPLPPAWRTDFDKWSKTGAQK
jgi:uncharacterized protein (TIGR02246 family)